MKILLVSNAFHPEISPRSFRAVELAKEFSRQSHEVTVLTRSREYDYHEYQDRIGCTLRTWQSGRLPDIPITGNKVLSLIARGLKRGLQMLFEYPSIEDMFHVCRLLRNEGSYDLIISFAVPYPVHWGTAWARTKKHRIANIWIADCGDPYMGDTTDTFRKLFYFRFIEKWFCRKTDFITVPFAGALAGYYPEFHHKIRIIPQGFNLEEFSIPAYSRSHDYPIFAYSGVFIAGKRDPRPLLDFLSTQPGMFRFVIYTPQRDLLEEAKKKLGNKLEIRSYIPRQKLLMKLSEMDFLVNFDNNVETQLPSKLIDYAITGRPVLNIKQGSDFAELVDFLKGDYSGKMELPDPDQYDIRNVSKQFLSIFTDVH